MQVVVTHGIIKTNGADSRTWIPGNEHTDPCITEAVSSFHGTENVHVCPLGFVYENLLLQLTVLVWRK